MFIMVHHRKIPPPKDVARERILKLSYLARESSDSHLGKRYMRLAEAIAKRMDMPLPIDIKRSYCKKCGHPYGNLTRVRIKRGLCLVTCSNCNDVRRIPYKQ